MQNALPIFVVLGLVIGSFGNVLICRVPKRHSIRGRSHCPRCKHVLSPLELIPVVSFILLRGRCKKCKKPISWQYPLVELTSGALFGLAYAHEFSILHSPFSIPLSAIILSLCLWLLLIMGVIDGKTGTLPDALNLPFVALAIAYGALHPPFNVAGVFLGSGFFLVQWVFSRGKWIGSGDVILGLGIGALLPEWQHVLLFLFLAYVGGGFVAALLLAQHKKKMNSHLSFGPFLSGSAIICALWGDWILSYMKMRLM